MGKPADIYNVILGTAGHIDHGKSTLVKRLTGIDPDRLPEEKEREMTIDLGFAPFLLKDGRKVGIIDVPGHERFIKNMVAGATSIDIVMLIVAVITVPTIGGGKVGDSEIVIVGTTRWTVTTVVDVPWIPSESVDVTRTV